MSVDLLFDLQQEVRRLFIAGSALAEGDPRLAKLLPGLKKLGESAPVFNRLAEAADGLVASSRDDSPVKLLELATLLSAVLHTQGKTETPGEPQPVEGSGLSLATAVPYRKLQPLIEALTTKGQGRLEQLRQAYEDRSFLDLRALPAVCAALDDSYAEIPDFVQEKLIPEFGLQAVPVLRNQLHLQGGKGDARRLALLHGLLGDAALDLVLEAASSGSLDLRVAAIARLGAYREQEPFLLEASREKRKEVRLAAYSALSRLGSSRAIDRLFEAVTSKDRELALESVRACRALELHSRIIAHAEEELERFLSGAGSVREEALQQLQAELRCLEGADRQLAGKIFPLLRKLLSTRAFLVPETEAVQEMAAELLLELDIPEGNRFALDLQQENERKFIGCSFRAAYKLLTPAELFNRFASELKGRSASAKELQRAIEGIVAGQLRKFDDGAEAAPNRRVIPEHAWDSRWVQVFAEQDLPELVSAFAHREDRKIVHYLTSKLKDGPRIEYDETQNMLFALFRIRYKDAPQLLLDLLEKKASRSFYYLDSGVKQLLSYLPKSSAPRLRSIAEKLTYESVKNEMLEIVEALEAAPDEPEESGKGLWGWIKNKRS